MTAVDRFNYKKVQRSYYNVNMYNDTDEIAPAKFAISTTVPLLHNPDQYEVAVCRCSVPLDGIPISQRDIPYGEWAIMVEDAHAQPPNSNVAVVAQFNTQTIITPIYSSYISYFSTTGGNVYQAGYFNDSNVLTSIIAPTIIGSTVHLAISNSYIYTVMFDSGSNIHINRIDRMTGLNPISSPSFGLDLAYIVRFTANDTYFAFLLIDNVIYTNNITYTSPNSLPVNAPITSTNINIITFQMQTLNSINYICLAMTYDNAGQNLHQASVYGFVSGSAYGPIADGFVQPADLPISYPSLVMIDNNSFYFQYLKTDGMRVIVNQQLSGGHDIYYDTTGFYLSSSVLAKYDDNSVLCVKSNASETVYLRQFLNTDDEDDTFTGFPPGQLFYSSPFISSIQTGSTTEIIPSIYYPIWTIQDYVNKINTALLSAFTAVFPPGNPQQPSIPYLSYSNAKFSMNVPASFTADSDYSISFNTRLGRRFLFNTKPGVVLTGVNPITTLTENFYPLQLLEENPNEENPITQIFNYPQPNSTAYKFFDITRIIIGSTKLSVAGDTELSNTSLLNITDFAVDTTSPNVLLQIYEPAILRYYQMYQTAPLTMLDAFLQYATKDGNIYNIDLIPGESASMKLLFRRSNLQITKF